MDRLPDEVMLTIFEWIFPCKLLGAVSQVCRRWAALVAHRALLIKCEDELQSCHKGLRGVRVVNRQTTNMLNKLFKFRNLRDITICSATPLSSDCFKALTHLEQLEHLDVFLDGQPLDASTIPILIRLRSLVINDTVKPHVINHLAGSERLQALHMYGRSFYFPRRDLLVLLEARCLHLRELTLRCSELLDFHYAAIGKCESLVTLQLYSCWLMSEEGALHVTRLPKLRSLHITSAKMVRSKALHNILAHLPRLLEELVLSGSEFSDMHVKDLQHLPMLRVLELWNCRLSGEGALVLANTVPSLRILDLDITLTNEQIKELNKHPNLLSVRCIADQLNEQNCRLNVSKYGVYPTGTVRVQRTNMNYPLKYFRNNGEGYSASLFYYWTQKMSLEP